MTSLKFKPVVALVVAGSMFVSSTAAVASAPSSAPRQIEPWAALSILSAGAPAAALCGAAAAAGQAPGAGCVLPAVDAAPAPVVEAGPPPPTPIPPVEPVGEGLGISPLYLALGALAAGALIYFLVIKKKHHNASPN
jgi:hypothetical protein